MKHLLTLFAILFSITTGALGQLQEYQGEQAPDIKYDFGEGFTQDPKFKQLLSAITVDNQNNVCIRLATDHNNVRVGDWFQLDEKNPVEESMIKNKNCGPGNVLHGRVDPRVFKSKPVFTFYENYAGPLNLLKKIRNYMNSDNFHYLYEMPTIQKTQFSLLNRQAICLQQRTCTFDGQVYTYKNICLRVIGRDDGTNGFWGYGNNLNVCPTLEYFKSYSTTAELLGKIRDRSIKPKRGKFNYSNICVEKEGKQIYLYNNGRCPFLKYYSEYKTTNGNFNFALGSWYQ